MFSSNPYISQTDLTDYKLPSGEQVRIVTWQTNFPVVSTRLVSDKLAKTYTIKPLVDFDGELLFGELAIVRLLEKDGWKALWVDTFHQRKFWNNMPHIAKPTDPAPNVRELYDQIATIKGSPSGCFDVVAWKNDRIIWLEYKGPGDRSNKNEKLWVQAALEAGVAVTDLMFVIGGRAFINSMP